MPQKNKYELSIVIPVFNEERYLDKLFSELIKYFNEKNVEVIFVNDGSTDKSKNIIESLKTNQEYKFNFNIINLIKNFGKGKAVREGVLNSSGKYVILQDADLELDLKDSKELLDIIKNNDEIKCIFGSRYLSGKLKKHNYFFNELFGKINSFIFNILFGQSLSDIHCGLKVLHRDVIDNIKLSINDFGLEIDLAAQIVRNNFFIYEYGVSYYFRTKQQGKKITWIDGVKSYYYLFKVRFIDNDIATNISIIFSSFYMSYVGSFFGKGMGTTLFIILFAIIGLFIGLKNKILSSSIILLFIYLGSLIGKGQGQVVAVIFFFVISFYFIYFVKKQIKKINNFILNYLF